MPPSGPPSTLVLVASALERARLEAQGGFPAALARLETCGFGPVAAAARAAGLVARLAPRRVLLVGIAGSFDGDAAPLGSAIAFGAVRLDGLGVGCGDGFLPPSRLGLPQWPGPPPIEELLTLAGAAAPELLTVCAASATAAERDARARRYPRVVGEDMEGFGVALACSLAGVPLAIVRGFSNRVGVRDKGAWRIDEALAAAHALALAWLARPDWQGPP